MADEVDAVHYAAQKLTAWMDARDGRLPRNWDFVSFFEQSAALAFVRAMKQAALEP
jgi:hypothetical protein